MSFSQPVETLTGITLGTLNILEVLRRLQHKARLFNAGSSECFGETSAEGANELTAFRPRSPYGVAKAAAISLVANYREAYDLFACSGLLFNHESPLRPTRFVTRKITAAAAGIAAGSDERLTLGNISIRRDWGWAPDYAEAMWRMLQRQRPDDFVIASGVAHSLEEFAVAAFSEVGLDWRDHVDFDAGLKRPSDISHSLGDPSKAARCWSGGPASLQEIVARMVRAEREARAPFRDANGKRRDAAPVFSWAERHLQEAGSVRRSPRSRCRDASSRSDRSGSRGLCADRKRRSRSFARRTAPMIHKRISQWHP